MKQVVDVDKEMEPKNKGPDKWEIENAADCLLRAEEVKSNKKLFALAQEHLGKKAKQIRSIQDIRDAAKNMSEDEE